MYLHKVHVYKFYTKLKLWDKDLGYTLILILVASCNISQGMEKGELSYDFYIISWTLLLLFLGA